ncbi:MAG TPA: 1,2-phenylacetyl-CoA epoxidase subunit PaaD [Rhizomicrobium sp.]|nr:1,2-phenylacetyl-CoA epoxidase subunit PaaD [Rhizomicrobium sp.]
MTLRQAQGEDGAEREPKHLILSLSKDEIEQRVLEILRRIPDPEIPCVSVVDLGIVRAVREDAVVVTPTYTGCPATVAIARDIRKALDDAGFAAMRIETVLSPPWTTDWISDEGREKLHGWGIAPPPKGAARHSLHEEPAQCPRCGSMHTDEISRFGSTPCKALHRCLDCSEPFDRFKCH